MNIQKFYLILALAMVLEGRMLADTFACTIELTDRMVFNVNQGFSLLRNVKRTMSKVEIDNVKEGSNTKVFVNVRCLGTWQLASHTDYYDKSLKNIIVIDQAKNKHSYILEPNNKFDICSFTTDATITVLQSEHSANTIIISELSE